MIVGGVDRWCMSVSEWIWRISFIWRWLLCMYCWLPVEELKRGWHRRWYLKLLRRRRSREKDERRKPISESIGHSVYRHNRHHELSQYKKALAWPAEEPNYFSSILLPQGIFHMIRNGDFANHGTFQKSTRETFKRYDFLKGTLVLIGWRSPISRAICTQNRVDTL
jgi:hypothetical protein